MWSIISTFVVVAVIIYLSYLTSKVLGKGLNKSTNSEYMSLVDQITLGQDRHIAIIHVCNKYLLIGVTSGQIRLLAEIAEDELEPLEASPQGGENRMLDFRSVLGKISGQEQKRR